MPVNASVDRALAAIEKDPSKLLGVTVNGKPVTKAQYIPRAEAQAAPEIVYPAADPSQTYMVVALDLDAPFTWWRGLGPILHWIQPGFKATAGGALKSSQPFVANYIGPAPPPGSAPHRYSFYIFTQPREFDGAKYAPADGKPLANTKRMWYDLDEWIKKAKLADPLAANYFVSN